jgi:hypothetical protein
MGQIVPRPMDFDECTINKSNTTLELCELGTQDLLLLTSKSLDLINNGEIDTRCNKHPIIIYCTHAPIPRECIILCDLVMLHRKDEVQQTLFQGQIKWLVRSAIASPMDLT